MVNQISVGSQQRELGVWYTSIQLGVEIPKESIQWRQPRVQQ